MTRTTRTGGRDAYMAPKWVQKLLERTRDPAGIVPSLLRSLELAPLWDRIPDERRATSSYLPELIAFHLPTVQGKVAISSRRLPWIAATLPTEQARRAKRVIKAARALNQALLDFEPLADVRLHQLWPQADHDHHLFLAQFQLAGMSPNDNTLSRLAEMAAAFRPQRSRLVDRPRAASAWRSYLIRHCQPITAVLFEPVPSPAWRDAFTAGLVNAIDPKLECHPEHVRDAMRRAPGRRAGLNRNNAKA